ncbi:MAG: hypothetical protein CMJ64_23365 [Planctomycetaceae bacterium]|jgi:Flp pilus assembly protein TadG|nr:hypothetical protein [Planctomycetaceae bacterium]
MSREAIIACLPYLAGIVVSVGLLRLLVWASGARMQLSQLRRLNADQHGAVQSLSFVLTLPLFVMILLFIVQLSQLTTARLVVEYAAMAAARSAVVWIPTTLSDGYETENRISAISPAGEMTDDNGVRFVVYQVSPGSPKYDKIRLAAATSLMSVCPSRDTGVVLDDEGISAATTMVKTYAAISPASVENTRIPTRIYNKLAFALRNTHVEIEIRHRNTDYRDRPNEPPLAHYDIVPYREEFEFNEIGYQDQIVVTVRHEFALLPGPGRFLSRNTPRRDGNLSEQDRVAMQVRRENGIFTYPISATARLNNEGEKSVLAYIQTLSGDPQTANMPPQQLPQDQLPEDQQSGALQ